MARMLKCPECGLVVPKSEGNQSPIKEWHCTLCGTAFVVKVRGDRKLAYPDEKR